jgi:hypothetical protein
VRREHPFNATTDRPPGSGAGGLANLKTSSGDVCTCMSLGAAALKVEQPVGLHRIADASRQGIEPLIVEVGHVTCEGASCECTAFFAARPIEHIAHAEHKSVAELVNPVDRFLWPATIPITRASPSLYFRDS